MSRPRVILTSYPLLNLKSRNIVETFASTPDVAFVEFAKDDVERDVVLPETVAQCIQRRFLIGILLRSLLRDEYDAVQVLRFAAQHL